LTPKGKEYLTRHEEYSKRCKSLEEHLNHVNNEKTVLEKMCYNDNKMNNNALRRDVEKELRK
jgi:hypothetical protein